MGSLEITDFDAFFFLRPSKMSMSSSLSELLLHTPDGGVFDEDLSVTLSKIEVA